ncbi:MAG: endonuclease III [Deltaproteobacteria bacterium]|nr:endonuclease III [Deltaproteobacteria bacterium]
MGGRLRNSTAAATSAAKTPPATEAEAAAIGARLAALYPDAHVELDHQDAYQLLVATILAAQAVDKTINTLTPALFAKFPDATSLAQADQLELEGMIKQSGFFRQKAANLIATARAIVERFGGEVPETMAELVTLPGVARKTANVVLGCALGKNEGFIVDTHVMRVAQRLGLTHETEPAKIEPDLMRLIPRDQWTDYANRLIWHGRRVCHARLPDCEHCALAPICPSAGLGASIVAEAEQRRVLAKAAKKAKAAGKAAKKAKAGKAGKAAKKAKAGKAAAGKARGAAKRNART